MDSTFSASTYYPPSMHGRASRLNIYNYIMNLIDFRVKCFTVSCSQCDPSLPTIRPYTQNNIIKYGKVTSVLPSALLFLICRVPHLFQHVWEEEDAPHHFSSSRSASSCVRFRIPILALDITLFRVKYPAKKTFWNESSQSNMQTTNVLLHNFRPFTLFIWDPVS